MLVEVCTYPIIYCQRIVKSIAGLTFPLKIVPLEIKTEDNLCPICAQTSGKQGVIGINRG